MGNCNSYNSSQTAWHCTATLCQALSTLLTLVMLCKPSLTSCFCEYGTTLQSSAPVYQALSTLPAILQAKSNNSSTYGFAIHTILLRLQSAAQHSVPGPEHAACTGVALQAKSNQLCL